MKKNNTLKVLSLLLLISGTFLFSSCSLHDDNPQIDPELLSGFMAINTVTDQDAVGVSLSGTYVGNSLPYPAYTGGYVSIYPGERSTDTYSATTGNTLVSTTYKYEKGNYYSLFILGLKDHYQNVIVEDNLNDLDVEDSTAYIRFINAVPNEETPQLTIAADSTVISSSQAEYAEVSPFEKVNAGEITITADNGAGIDTKRTIKVAGQNVYTLLLVGDSERNDSEKSVQIRYIENGKLIKEEESESEDPS